MFSANRGAVEISATDPRNEQRKCWRIFVNSRDM